MSHSVSEFKMHLFAGARVLALFCGGALALSAQAQESAGAGVQAEAQVEEIVVTASRVQRAGFEAPTPTTVLNAEALEKLGTTDVGSTLAQLPAFQTDQNGSTNPLGGDAGRRYANLRNLGSQRTLVLMDGQRLPPSALTGQTDLNSIPQILINRIDVVTGGASAQWGSDAVAGVVNMITKKNIEGLQTDVSYGESSRGDNVEKRIGMAYGTKFADGRARLVMGGEWADNHGVGDMYTRDWGREEWGLVRNPNSTTNQLLVLPNVRRSVVAPGGLITSGPLAGITFDRNGQPRYYDFGEINGGTGGTMSGGDGYAEGDGQGTPLKPPVERAAGQIRLSYELNSNVEVFGQANLNYINAVTNGPGPLDYASPTGIVIRSGNPYIPDSIQQAMTNQGITSFQLARYWKDDVNGDSDRLSRPIIDSLSRAQTYTLGANGRFGEGWTWDSYAQYAQSSVANRSYGYRINSRFYQSVDAVTNDSGAIVCRSTLTNPNDGCVPVNLLGQNTVTPEAFAWFTGNPRLETDYKRQVYAANLNGIPFSTWAGDVAIATGVEHRRDEADVVQKDPLALARAYNYGNSQPISGDLDVTEGYLEVAVPLLKDVPMAQNLEFSGAVRQTNYSTSGNVTTWKVGLNDAINDSLRLRASVSRDIRAPNVSELYTGVSTGIANVFHPNTGVLYAVTTQTSGNENLDPERSRTVTGGFAFTPTFLPDFRFSADIYNIQINDVIASINAATVFNYCYTGGAQNFCDLLSFQGPATATAQLPLVNLASLEVRGVDAEMGYGLPMSKLFNGAEGRLDFNLFLTYQYDVVIDNGTTAIDRAGDLGSAARPYGGPKWKWNLLSTYSAGRFSGTLGLRYVGGGKKDVTYTEANIDDNSVDSVIYTNLALGYDLPFSGWASSLKLYGNVQNLFDVNPPVDPMSGAGNPFNAIFHDVVGRTYTVGLRAQF